MKKLSKAGMLAAILFTNPVVPSKYSRNLLTDQHRMDLSRESGNLRDMMFGAGAGMAASRLPEIIISIFEQVSRAASQPSGPAADEGVFFSETVDEIPQGGSESPDLARDLINELPDLGSRRSGESAVPESSGSSRVEPLVMPLSDDFVATSGGTASVRDADNTPNAASDPSAHKATPGGSVKKR